MSFLNFQVIIVGLFFVQNFIPMFFKFSDDQEYFLVQTFVIYFVDFRKTELFLVANVNKIFRY